MSLHVLSAGAAKGVVTALRPAFASESGVDLDATFGAVGAMRELLVGGAACDVLILSQKLIEGCLTDGQLVPGSEAALGSVPTGLAVRTGGVIPEVSTPVELKAALLNSGAIYVADTQRSTAGTHFAGVLRELAFYDEVAPRLLTHPNGATAMAHLARADEPRAIGCSQVTEVRYTGGVSLIGRLPGKFALDTVYAAGVAASATQPDLAQLLVTMLTSEFSRQLRADGGFEV